MSGEEDAENLILNRVVKSISHHGNILYLNMEGGKTVIITAESEIYLAGGGIHSRAHLNVKVDLPSTDR